MSAVARCAVMRALLRLTAPCCGDEVNERQHPCTEPHTHVHYSHVDRFCIYIDAGSEQMLATQFAPPTTSERERQRSARECHTNTLARDPERPKPHWEHVFHGDSQSRSYTNRAADEPGELATSPSSSLRRQSALQSPVSIDQALLGDLRRRTSCLARSTECSYRPRWTEGNLLRQVK